MKLKIIILMGNFHNEMASLTGIGYLMKNSGIEEVMQLIYKVNTTKAVLLDIDYERGVRVLGLIASALKRILLEQIPEDVVEACADYLESLESHEVLPDDVEDSLVVARLFKELEEVKARLRASDTNRLRLDTYLQWYDAFLANFHSERLGQWDAYKDSLKQLLPFFASGARRNYIKWFMWFLSELNHLAGETDLLSDDLLRGTEVSPRISPSSSL